MAKITEKDYKVMYREIIQKNKENQNEIGELVIIKNGISSTTFKNNVLTSPYTKSLSENDKKLLIEMIDVVEDYENKLIKMDLPIAELLINSYISSESLTVKDYCEENELTAETFERAKRLVSLYDKNKYTIFNSEQKLKDVIRRKLVSEEIEQISYLINNGVELENGEIRGFDLIDYYECTNVPPKSLYILINTKKVVLNNVNSRDLIVLKKYLSRVSSNLFNMNPINDKIKLKDVVKFAQRDENGKIIEGSFREITEEEKLSLLEYLKTHKIPLIEGTYEAGIRRIGNNTFGIDEKNIERKINKQLVLK